VNGDQVFENNETMRVNLSSPVNATLGISSATGTIINDDRRPAIRIDDASTSENSQLAQVRVYLTAPNSETIKVKYETKDKTAKAPGDYTASSGQLIFQPGETEKWLNITIKADNLFEPTETFEVRLKDAQNASLDKDWGARKEAEVRILNSVSTLVSNNRSNNVATEFSDQLVSLNVKVLPNPSRNHFSLSIKGNGQGSIQLRVTDIQGRIVESRVVEGSFRQVQLGDRWSHGNYILEIRQGAERKVLQLVKLK
jgi:hypothetical protein